jgi:hypothetical protein
MPITSKDHEQLHEWIARAALAGAAATVTELLSARMATPFLLPVVGACRLLFIVAAVVPPRSFVDGAGVLLLALIAAALRGPTWVGLPLAAVLTGIGLARGLGTSLMRRRVLTASVGAVGALIGLAIQRAFWETGALTSLLGPGLGALLGGAIGGAVTGLGALGRFLGQVAPVEASGKELERLAAEVRTTNAEVGALLSRAADAHREAAEVIGSVTGAAAPATQRAAEDLVKRLVHFAHEWLEVERRAISLQPEPLIERKALLEARLEKSTDPVAKTELGRAIAAVQAQSDALIEILRGRERAVARLEHQVATLERLRLAALRHRSADAGRLQAELAPVLEELADAGGDYDLASDAIRDADGEVASAELAPTRAN